VGRVCPQRKIKNDQSGSEEQHGSHTRNLPARIDVLKMTQAALDGKGEETDLSEEELNELHSTSMDIHSLRVLILTFVGNKRD
jgi:hypothetical protein